jgi:hypothetical protein
MSAKSCIFIVSLVVLAAVACGGAVSGVDSTERAASANPSDARNPAPTSTSTPQPPIPATCRVPAKHRASAVACDDVRPSGPVVPDGSGPQIKCTTHEECTNGKNGRCIGNSHDGWACTYDGCQTDSECGATGICACEGGFRSDHNVCLSGDCRVDADCAPANAACGSAGFCAPTLGDCGHYGKTAGYFCHTPDDECTDDTDCSDGGSAYCAYEQSVGHWKCSSRACAG